MDTVIIGPFDQILTMNNLPRSGPISDNQLEIIEKGGIRVVDGAIVEIGKFSDIRQSSDIWEEVQSPCVAIPGLIDAHTHICWAGTRAGDYSLRLQGYSYQEIAARGGGILDTTRKTREASEETLVEGVLSRAAFLIKNGVTTCEVKSGYGLNLEDELKILDVIQKANLLQPVNLISTCLAAHSKPPEYASHEEYLRYIANTLLPMIKHKKLSHRCDIFVEEGAFSSELAKRYLMQAKQLGFDLVVHADQFTVGGSQVACEVGAVSADHLECSSDAEFAMLKRAGVIPIALPGASLGLGQHFAKGRKMLDAGLPLVIASDWNPGSAPMGQLLTQAAVFGAAEKLTMAETLAGITVRAAMALRMPTIGKLCSSMRADITCYKTKDFREILYYQGSLQPVEVYVGGEKVV